MSGFFSKIVSSRREAAGFVLAAPAVVYLVAFFVVPTAIMFVYSFWQSKAFVIIPDATLQNYVKVFTLGNALTSLWTALVIGFWTAVLACAASYPVAWYIAYRAKSNLLLYVVLLSWFSSYLVRVFAWRVILGTNGMINSSLIYLGVIDEPLEFLIFSPVAVTTALVHIFLPFTLLLILSALRNISRDYLDAARDLGASRTQVFFKVVAPMAYKGLVGSFMFTFILAAGDYVTPQLLGGRGGVTIGLLISNQFRQTGNWPYGAALAFMLLAVFLLIYLCVVLLLRRLKLAPGLRFHPLDDAERPSGDGAALVEEKVA